jgi:hypothetical protein
MYLTRPANLGEPEPSQVRPEQTLPYREAMEQTERRLFDEYSRACTGVELLQTLQRAAQSPSERVRFWEKVIDWLPKIFEVKRLQEEQVRVGRMSRADADANLAWQMRHVFPPGYALTTLDSELARARCALSKARWQFMAWQRTGHVPGERRLLHGRLGEPPPTRGCRRNPIDARAAAIIAAAQDQSQPLDVRGRDLVRAICRTYFPSEGAKVSGVQFAEPLPGLRTQSEGAGATTRGLIRVGRYFVENTHDHLFARRVLQVGHELRHIDQWRAGMVGPARKAEREFLAHFWVATTPEPSGTGCMPHATRVNVIDAALGNFYCMSQADRARHAHLERTLLTLRQREQAASGHAPTAAPVTCRPSH